MKKNEQISIISNIIGTKESGYITKFGKYKGEDISNVPSYYLQWCIKSMGSGEFTIEAEKELERRRCRERQ